MLHTVYKLASIQNDAREQRFDVTVATVAAVAVQQISYCMVSRDHMGILICSPITLSTTPSLQSQEWVCKAFETG